MTVALRKGPTETHREAGIICIIYHNPHYFVCPFTLLARVNTNCPVRGCVLQPTLQPVYVLLIC